MGRYRTAVSGPARQKSGARSSAGRTAVCYNTPMLQGDATMTRIITCAVSALLVAEVAHAHVTVRPRESKAGATETYTVRVPTEGKVATISVEVEIPRGVTIKTIE